MIYFAMIKHLINHVLSIKKYSKTCLKRPLKKQNKKLVFNTDYRLCFVYTMFPAVTVARNVARPGVFSLIYLRIQVLLSLASFSHGLPRYP